VNHADYPQSASERAQGHALLCSCTAVSDLVIEMLEARAPDDIPAQEVVAKVKSATPLAADLMLLHLQTPRSSRLRFLAGQGVTLSVTGSTADFRADYPIASCPCDDRNLLFHIRREPGDEFAGRLFAGALRPNDPVSVFGPWGSFVLRQDSTNDIVFLACDTGFAPVKSLIEHAVAADVPGMLRLVWAATEPAGHYLENQCRAWADALETFSYAAVVAPDPEAAGRAAARRALDEGDHAGRDFYVVGPSFFVSAAAAALAAAGLPAVQLRTEVL
jgi:CDP-4-dehydro-6-deoxyglucose reductase